MSQTYYGPTIKHLLSIVDGELDVYHANFSVHPPSSALNPNAALATEVVGHYFSADLSDSEKSTWESDLDKFAKVLEENAQGYRGFLGGWVVEEQEHKEVDGKTILWLSLLGWDSVEAHMAFRETDAFKDNVHLMRPDFKKASTLHHVKFQPV